jgi:ligand-binding sensor domain-containing protein
MQFRYTIILVLFFFIQVQVHAQDSLAIGEWGSFLPYTTGNYVSQSEDKIIYSTQWSLFTVDKQDLSIELFDKINMLTDIGITRHNYDMSTKQLIVLYRNSNIDIIRGTEVINIPDIRNNTTIIGDKQIYDVHPNGDGTVYFSCGFGVVQFDLISYEFGFTCVTDVPVYQTIEYNNLLVAATEDGLYVYDQDLHNNPSDFSLWTHLGGMNSLPDIYLAKDVTSWNEHLYISTGEEVYKSGSDLQFEEIYASGEDSQVDFLNHSEGNLMVGVSWEYNQGKVLFFDSEDQYIQSNPECANEINFAIVDEAGRVWFGDRFRRGEIRYAENRIAPCQTIHVNSPFSNNVSDIESAENKLYIASGGVDESYKYLYRKDGFFIWDGAKWNNYTHYNTDVFLENDIQDFFRILPHSSKGKVYIGTYQSGLVEMDIASGSFKLFNQYNSTLEGKTGDTTRVRISGLATDREDNLWISNFGAPKPISVYTPEGEWVAMSVKSGKDLRDVAIDDYGNKWVVIDREVEGFLIFNEGDDLNSSADDRQRIVTRDNSNLESNAVNDIEVDLNGDVWIGTADGPVVFECGSDVFNVNCKGIRRKTSLEGFGAYVLDDVNITCIETDGANRKWFGSNNGIFVQSPSGEDQVYHFTKDNSPLFDNAIIDMAYNDQNGTMFIATAMGVMSFRTRTSGANDRHRGDIYAYPNPVRPDYYGPIAIKGFARDSNIKITDINGQLVHESTSFGGQAIWDGYDYNGRRAASGVYLVFASTTNSFDEPSAVVTKIMIINGE